MGSDRVLPKDSLAREFDAWIDVIPGAVDTPAELVRQRIGRLSRQFERVLAEVAHAHGLSTGDSEALSVLARSTQGDSLTPGELGRILGLTSGTVSVRIERLVSSRLVERTDGSDKRQRPVRLTARGKRAWGQATVARTRIESALMRDCLSAKQLEELGTLLGKLLARVETEYGPAPRHDMTRGRAHGQRLEG